MEEARAKVLVALQPNVVTHAGKSAYLLSGFFPSVVQALMFSDIQQLVALSVKSQASFVLLKINHHTASEQLSMPGDSVFMNKRQSSNSDEFLH